MGVVYSVQCECGKDLKFTVSLDNGDDLCVEVEPCEDCIEVAVEEERSKHE